MSTKCRANVMGYNIDDQMRRYDHQYFDPVADIPESELDPERCPIAQAPVVHMGY